MFLGKLPINMESQILICLEHGLFSNFEASEKSVRVKLVEQRRNCRRPSKRGFLSAIWGFLFHQCQCYYQCQPRHRHLQWWVASDYQAQAEWDVSNVFNQLAARRSINQWQNWWRSPSCAIYISKEPSPFWFYPAIDLHLTGRTDAVKQLKYGIAGGNRRQ